MMTGEDTILSTAKAMVVETGLSQGYELEMNLGRSEIPKMDVLSQSDPFCVVYSGAGGDCWDRIGLTETVVDSHTCKWVKKFFLDMKLVTSKMRFEVFDRDSDKESLKAHDFIGYAEGMFVKLMIEEKKVWEKIALSREGGKKELGYITITLDWIEKPVINFFVTLELLLNYSARIKMFYEVMKQVQKEGHYVPVFRSKLLGKDDSAFEPCTLRLTQLCGGSSSRLIRIQLFHFYPNGRSKVLGFVRTSVGELSNATTKTRFPWNSCNNGLDEARVFVTSKRDGLGNGKAFQISILG